METKTEVEVMALPTLLEVDVTAGWNPTPDTVRPLIPSTHTREKKPDVEAAIETSVASA